MWLRDALPQYLPNARIVIYGYASKLAGSRSFQNLHDVGSRFRASLKVALGPVPRERPLIFIAHSFGGLALKEAMVQMYSGSAAESRSFKATFAILCFGVPNQGMEIEYWLAMVHGQPNLHLLSTLSKDGGVLQDLDKKFRTVFNFRDSHIYSFYETDMSPTAQEGDPGKWAMTGRPAVLVDRFSARSGRSWEEDETFPISRNHSEMVKFSEYSEDCGIVCDILRQYGKEAHAVISHRWEKELGSLHLRRLRVLPNYSSRTLGRVTNDPIRNPNSNKQGRFFFRYEYHDKYKLYYGKAGDHRCRETNCKFISRRPADLLRHTRSRHCRNPERFRCSVLGCIYHQIGFARKDNLNSHYQKIHKGKLPSKL